MYIPAHLRFFRAPDPEPTGGGGTSPPPPPASPPPPPASVGKTMTEAEVKAMLEEQKKQWKLESDEEAKRQADIAQGKYKDLYEREQTAKTEEANKRIAAEKETRELKVRDKLRDYVQKNAADYAGSMTWISKALDITPEDDDSKIDAKIKEVVEQFKKDNPLRTVANTGTPESPVNRGRVATHKAIKGDIQISPDAKEEPRRYNTIGWRPQ